MIKRIGGSGAYVTGAVRSAIYQFDTGNVYSINQEGTKLLSAFFSGAEPSAEDRAFLSQVSSMTGLCLDDVSDYPFPPCPPTLNFAWLELTQACNLRCVHCYQGECHGEPDQPLSVSEWKRVIAQCAAAGCGSIQFIGGEPSVCAFLPELISFAHEAGIGGVSIFSNLFSLPEQLLSVVIDYRVSVNFSLYGASAPVHDRITQIPGSFDRLMAHIKQLQAHSIPLRAHVVMMRENEGEYRHIEEFLHSMGINSIHYDEIRKVYGGTQSPHMLSRSTLQLRKPNFRADRASFEQSLRTNTCWFGKLAVSTDGSVYPCEFEHQLVYGNVRRMSIADILAGDMVQTYWYLSYAHILPCRDCEYRFACKDCRPLAYAECGSRTGQNPRCFYNPAAGTWG